MDKLGKPDFKHLKNLHILYVEDDNALRTHMVELLRLIFDHVCPAKNGKEGLELFRAHSPHIVITDIKMPVMDGLEMSAIIKQEKKSTPIIITSAFNDTDYMIKAIELGVDRFVPKPIEQDSLLNAISTCAVPVIQENKIEGLDHALENSLLNRLGNTPYMRKLINRIRQVAETNFSVVLQGETGVGKSLVAEIIHELSPRAGNPFVTVEVGSIPETLIESELFGHKKGSYTGAVNDKKGFLEAAHRGTIFFDEIQDMSFHVQSKLLRAVEEHKIYPVGSTKSVEIDIRIICATNIDLKKSMEEKKFREDLFYRFFEFDITILPLRERVEDIEFFARRFIHEAARELNKKCSFIPDETITLLSKQKWPGNVRQLKNVIRRAVLECTTGSISTSDILNVLDIRSETPRNNNIPLNLLSLSSFTLENVEKWAILEALKQTSNKRMKAAQILKIDYKRLIRKMEKYGITTK